MHSRNLRTGLTLALVLPCLLAGCYVKVDKGKNGEDKDVDVHLPMGGLHVHQDTPSAADLGLPTYPGASLVDDKDGHSANVHVGFGDWQITVLVAKYQTPDSQAKVTSFYRGSLARYGEVLECQGGHAAGSMRLTREGLGCTESHGESKSIHLDDDLDTFNLRAGSQRHQHIVAIKPGDGGGTRFILLRLDLPAALEQADKEE